MSTRKRAVRENVSGGSLECPICTQPFVAGDTNRRPRLLLCGHSFCSQCIFKLPIRDGCVSCPVCTENTPMQGSRAKQQPKINFALEELLSLPVMKAAGSKTSPCKNCEKQAASLFCVSCACDLCSDCSQQVHAMKVLSNHKVVPIAQKSTLPIVVQCDTHIGHVRDLYCPECKVAVCDICRDYDGHQTHKVELLAAVADRYRKQVQGLIDTCMDTESKAKTEISKVTSHAAEIKRSFENVKAEIESYAENLRSAIDLAVVAVLRDAKQSHGISQRDLESKKRRVSLVMSAAGSAAAYCKLVMAQPNASLIDCSGEVEAKVKALIKEEEVKAVPALLAQQPVDYLSRIHRAAVMFPCPGFPACPTNLRASHEQASLQVQFDGVPSPYGFPVTYLVDIAFAPDALPDLASKGYYELVFEEAYAGELTTASIPIAKAAHPHCSVVCVRACATAAGHKSPWVHCQALLKIAA